MRFVPRVRPNLQSSRRDIGPVAAFRDVSVVQGGVRAVVARGSENALVSNYLVPMGIAGALAFMVLMPLGRIKCCRVLSLLHGSEVLRFEHSLFWKFCANL